MRWHRWVVSVSGPLAPDAEGYERWLAARGYSPGTTQIKVWQLSQLSRWLEREGLGVGEWTEEMALRFAAAQHAAGYRSYLSALSLRVPLAYLREVGTIGPASVASGPVEELLADLRVYLARERGLVPGTIRNYERAARVFLEDRFERAGGLELDRLAAGDVSAFLARECPRRSVSGAMDLAANLRALLRYLHVVGLIDAPLVWAVPKVADLRGRSLPKGLAPGAVTGMLAACDPVRTVGRRDLAVLLLLARLGLRAGEVAAIGLEDVDWRAVSCWCAARVTGRTGCRCPSTWARRWCPISVFGRAASIACCSCACWRRSGRSAAAGSRRSCVARAGVPGWRRSGRTGCGIPPRPRCSAPTCRLRRSRRCCAIAISNRPRTTRAWIETRCDRSRCRGRETGHDRDAPSTR